MNKRPHTKETEDDILKLEQEFLNKKVEPSVKIVKTENVLSKISNANPQTSKTPDGSVSLVGNVIFKRTKTPENTNVFKFKSGFPQATKRETTTISKKGSIFSQQKKLKCQTYPSKSYILTGLDTCQIHQENVDTLSKLTESEILEEQKKLLDTLDPKLIDFLKSKRQNLKMETEEFKTAKIDDEVFDNVGIETSKNWLNFDKVETEKLKWTENVKKVDSVSELYEARFDFNGYILPYGQDMTEENRSLFHHGDEPNRPGYTIQELFKLSRANVPQQRILSLNTIANILSLNSTGIYDTLKLNIPVEQIFFIIRLSVDENVPSILTASLKCLHNIYHCDIDETGLTILSNFGEIYEPMLAIDLKEDDREFNDQQLAELDLVRILARTNIFIRIRYILNTIKPNFESVIYCLEILIRLARDSNNINSQLFNTENLIEIIISNFLPQIYKFDNIVDNCYNKPVIQCIKLLKILCNRSKNICKTLIIQYNILNSLISYISINNTNNIYGIQIQNESLKLLNIIFKYNLNISQFREFDNILLSLLTYHIGNTGLNTTSYTVQTNLSSILNLISTLAKIDFNLIKNFVPTILNDCCPKYFSQAANLTTFKLGDLQILSSLLATLSALDTELPTELKKLVSNFIKSPGFYKITENIQASSNLLSEFDTHKTGPNFNSVEAAMWQTSEHIVPTLNTKSPVLFLKNFSRFINKNSDLILISEFLEHDNIKKYLNQLKNKGNFNLTNNWFTKCESEFVLNVLKCSVKCQNMVNLFLYYELAVKCLSILTDQNKNDVEFLLKNIIFNKRYIPEDVLMNELSLNNDLKNVLNYLNDICICYLNVLDIKQTQNEEITNYIIDIKIGNIIPIDWIYIPIMYLHTKYEAKQLNAIPENDQVTMVTSCLQWIYLYENYFSNFSGLNITEKFCRLCCVFLCSNNIFLEEKIQYLLSLNLKKLIENVAQLDFSANIKGLGSFESFYQQLLEQYQGVSYGNNIFANFILIPSIQKQNIKWRKMLWSQYSGAVETIFLTEKDCLLKTDEFLIPPEKDVSLLRSYKLVLSNKNFKIRCPFLHFVITKHLNCT